MFLPFRSSDGLDDLFVIFNVFESFDLAITHDPQFLADGSEKVDIVRDNDHAALEVLRRADQCINSFHVEVIGRFVHDNDVRQLPSDDCKGYARLLTARQLAAGAQRHGARNTEVAEMSTKFEVLVVLLIRNWFTIFIVKESRIHSVTLHSMTYECSICLIYKFFEGFH